MSDYFQCPAKQGEIALVEIRRGRKTEQVLVPPGNHAYPEGVRHKRFLGLISKETTFAFSLPRIEVVAEVPRMKTGLSVYYTLNFPPGSSPWVYTKEFWKRRKADFARSFLERLKLRYTGGKMLFHLVEEGQLVNLANQAWQAEAKTAADGSYFFITVFGVNPGECKEICPFHEQQTAV